VITIRTNTEQLFEGNLKALEGLSKKGGLQDQVVRKVALGALTDVRMRVFTEGKDSNSSKIGNYSTRAGYFTTRGIGKGLSARGKTGRTKFKNGRSLKTRYFADGYSGWKTAIGRNTLGSVNLNLSGSMRNNFQLFKTSSGWGIGWSSDKLVERARHFETKKYNKAIWMLTKKEQKEASRIALIEIGNAIRQK